MSGVSGSKAWAYRLAARVEAGEFVERSVIELASQVIGRPILRGGKHAVRPDAKDRQAGDFDMVPL